MQQQKKLNEMQQKFHQHSEVIQQHKEKWNQQNDQIKVKNKLVSSNKIKKRNAKQNINKQTSSFQTQNKKQYKLQVKMGGEILISSFTKQEKNNLRKGFYEIQYGDEELIKLKQDFIPDSQEDLSNNENQIQQQNSNSHSLNNHEYDSQQENMFQKSNNLTSEQWLCIQQLQIHKKKNVAKNIMTAFKNFIANPLKFGYSQIQIDFALSCYNKSKKIEETFEEMQNKFLKYIVKKKFNHYTIKLLIFHPNYGQVFEYFIKYLSDFWLDQSKVHDTKAHLAMINFLKEAYNDIDIINQLKKYDKRKY